MYLFVYLFICLFVYLLVSLIDCRGDSITRNITGKQNRDEIPMCLHPFSNSYFDFWKNYKERILLSIRRLLFEKIKKYSIMESVSYIKADNNKIINERAILWVRKLDRCLAICTKSIGCDGIHDTHRICKSKNPDSYNKLNKHFE